MNLNHIRGRIIFIFLALACMSLGRCGGYSGDGATNSNPLGDSDPNPGPVPEPRPGWVLQASGTEFSLNAVLAIDSDYAWAAGGAEAGVRRSRDGGSTWTALGPVPEIQYIGGSPETLQIQFLDQLNGWALTRYSVLSTSDGGQTWTTREGSLVQHYSAMSFLNATTGWVATTTGALIKTSDGGETWTWLSPRGPSDEGMAIWAVRFIDDHTGWIALRAQASGEEIRKTDDGGITWQQQLFIEGAGDSLRLSNIFAVSPNRVWIVGRTDGGDQGELIKATTDGGATWTEQRSDGSSGIRAVHFVDDTVGWAVGRKIHHTLDGGVTWRVQPTSQEWFRDVVFVSATTGWVVGLNGVILKTSTGGVE